MKKYVLIVAGGSGTRMSSLLPKQFIGLEGVPVLMHTIRCFYNYSPTITIVLVLPKKDIKTWELLCAKHNFDISIKITEGGSSRFQSVKKGLELIEEEGFVAIHDGVRPLVTKEIIENSFVRAQETGSAVTVVDLKDSIRKIDGKKSIAVDRRAYVLVQTPQTFKISSIKKAYQIEEDNSITDDASVAEKAGLSIEIIEGSYENIKITTPSDLYLAEAILKERRKEVPDN